MLGAGLLVFAATTFISSCKRNKFAGPELATAKEGFALTSSFSSTSDLLSFNSADPTLGFSASFNQKVTWKVIVEGLNSGAKKSFSGTTTGFDETTVLFDGRANGVPFFQSDEYMRAMLLVEGIKDTMFIDSLETVKAYTYHKKTRNGVKHVLVDDFESTSSGKYAPVSLAIATDALDSDIDFIADTNYFVDGFRSYKMLGRDDNNNGWSGGMNSENLIDFYLVQDTSQLLIDSGIKPEDLYFNMYVYGTGKSNTTVEFKVYEFDHDSIYISSEDSTYYVNNRQDMKNAIFQPGVGGPPTAKQAYDQTINDGWIYDQEVTWTGWKLVSVPYSQFRAANDLAMGGNGDRVKESWRICGMAVSLLSYPTTGMLTETYIDYLTITQGGRFQQ